VAFGFYSDPTQEKTSGVQDSGCTSATAVGIKSRNLSSTGHDTFLATFSSFAFACVLMSLLCPALSCKAAEWGNGSLKGTWRRLLVPLPVDRQKRRQIIAVSVFLHNFRARTVGYNQIKARYSRNWVEGVWTDRHLKFDRLAKFTSKLMVMIEALRLGRTVPVEKYCLKTEHVSP